MAAGSFKIYGLQKDGSRIPAAGSAGGGGQEFINMTADEFEALSITEKQQLYSNGIRVVAVDGELDANNMSDMQRFAAFVHPVGEIVELTIETNPATLWGFGIWESFMPGRVLVGAGTADSGTVYAAGQTGGLEEEKIESKHFPWNTVINSKDGSHSGNATRTTVTAETWCFASITDINGYVDGADYGVPMSNMPPYAVIYRWLRVA